MRTPRGASITALPSLLRGEVAVGRSRSNPLSRRMSAISIERSRACASSIVWARLLARMSLPTICVRHSLNAWAPLGERSPPRLRRASEGADNQGVVPVYHACFCIGICHDLFSQRLPVAFNRHLLLRSDLQPLP